MRITKVYTRTGDKGTTRLASGQMISKDHLRLEAYGTIDELNSVIGIVRAFLPTEMKKAAPRKWVDEELQNIQDRLFDLGAILATASQKKRTRIPVIEIGETRRLEIFMDRCQKDLKPLKEFILPGGSPVCSFLHQARTVGRRAERACVRLNRKEIVPSGVIPYVNRLSDAFFVMARWIAWIQKKPEVYWNHPNRGR